MDKNNCRISYEYKDVSIRSVENGDYRFKHICYLICLTQTNHGNNIPKFLSIQYDNSFTKESYSYEMDLILYSIDKP